MKDENENSVLTLMESYTEFDGVPNVANGFSLRNLLRGDLKFDGVLVTDYQEIENLVNWHHVAIDDVEGVKLTLSEGSVDISMVPFNIESWRDNVLKSMGINPVGIDGNEHVKTLTKHVNEFAPYPIYPTIIKEERLDESVKRILRLKDRLNMLNEIITPQSDLLDEVGNSKDRKIGLDMARESIILTKNHGNILPLINKKFEKNLKVHVTGPTSDSIRYQSGGWTIEWQGARTDEMFSYGTSVLDATQRVHSWDVSHSCGVDIMGNDCGVRDHDEKTWVAADYIIICVGEENYTEKPGDITDLSLPEGQIQLVNDVKSVSNGKIILIYFGGRPRLLGDIVEMSDAIFISFLPGPDAGQAVVDLVLGDGFTPSGRLPITYPKHAGSGGIPYWSAVSDQCTSPSGQPFPHYQYMSCEVEWPFGHGLSYTNFTVSNFSVTSSDLIANIESVETSINISGSISISLNIKNEGQVTGSEVLTYFIFDENRHVTPEYKRLWKYEKVRLSPGQDQDLKIKLDVNDMRYIGPHNDKHSIIQFGMKFRVGVGPESDCRLERGLCTDFISVFVSQKHDYIASCEAACNIWDESECSSSYDFRSKSCYELCLTASSDDKSSAW